MHCSHDTTVVICMLSYIQRVRTEDLSPCSQQPTVIIQNNVVFLYVIVGIKINSDNYQLVPLNSNATFSCSDTMHHIQAFIVTFVDEAPLDTIVLSEVIESLAKRNVYLDSTDSSLFVLATEENNGTIIQCRDVSIEGMTDFSEQLTLMVIGMYYK